MKYRLFLALIFCLGTTLFAEENVSQADSSAVNAASVPANESSVADGTPASEKNVAVDSVVATANEKSVDSISVAAPLDTTAEAPVDSSKTVKKSGLMASLYPVELDESIAKGHVLGGATLSLIQGNTDKDALNIMIGDVYKAYGYTFTVEAFGGYFVKDAMAVGARAGYSRTWYDIDFTLLKDLLDLTEHRKYVSNGFFVQPFLKNYLKILNSKSLYFFNETSVTVDYSYGISQSDDGNDVNKSRNRSWSIDVGINPGVCIMVLNGFAFETSVGLLGLSTSVIEVEENGKTTSEVVFNVVNFTINLLALNFSLVYFF